MARLSELFNVNQFIVSQVNPHAPLLLSMGGSSPCVSMFPIPRLRERLLLCWCGLCIPLQLVQDLSLLTDGLPISFPSSRSACVASWRTCRAS